MTEAKMLSALHFNLLDLIRSESRVHAFEGSNAYLAKRMEVSESKVKSMLRDLAGRRSSGEQQSWGFTTEETDKAPLEEGFIEIHTTKAKKVSGAWQKRRVIYLVSSEDDETGARQVATLASRFGQETRYATEYFCGQLQCTPKQFRRWLMLCVEHRWLDVLVALDRSRSIRRVADCIPYVDQLPDRLCREVYDPQTGDLLKSESTWMRLREPTLADRIRELVVKDHDSLCVLSDPEMALRLGAPKRSVTAAIARLKQEARLFSHAFAPGGGRGRILSVRRLTDEEVNVATPLTTAQERKLRTPKPPPRKRGRPAKPKPQPSPPAQPVFRQRDLVAAVNEYIDERNRKRIDRWMPDLSRWELGPEPDRVIGEHYAFTVALKRAHLQVDRAFSDQIDECSRRRETEEREAEARERLEVRGRECGPWTSNEWGTIDLLKAYVDRAARRLRMSELPFDVLEARRDLLLLDEALQVASDGPWGVSEQRASTRLARERRSRALRRSLGMPVEAWQPADVLERARALDEQEQRRAAEEAAKARKLLLMAEPVVFPMVVNLLKSVFSGAAVLRVTAEEVIDAISEVRRSGAAKLDFAVAEAAARVVAAKRWGIAGAGRLDRALARPG